MRRRVIKGDEDIQNIEGRSIVRVEEKGDEGEEEGRRII